MSDHIPPSAGEPPKLKIYFLPNLLTAGNLFCGFVALTKIVEADVAGDNFGIQLDAGTNFWTTVSGAPSGNVVTLAVPLPSQASQKAITTRSTTRIMM